MSAIAEAAAVPVPVDDEKTIQLQSNDDQVFPIKLKAANDSTVIKRLLEDLGYDGENEFVIPLPNVKSVELKKIIVYLEAHMGTTKSATDFHEDLHKEKVDDFDKKFIDVNPLDKQALVDMYLAANYMGAELLKELCAYTVASTLKGKTPEEINEMWGLENDFSPEEREEIRKEHAWILDNSK